MSLLAAVILLSLSCSGNDGGNGRDARWTPTDLQGDYSYMSDGDTITLQLKMNGDSLHGPLIYSFSEKDKNQGTFHGVIEDSLLIGTYNFLSEGLYSSRETVFEILPDGLLEGFGEIEHYDSIAVFVNRYDLRFDHGMVLERR